MGTVCRKMHAALIWGCSGGFNDQILASPGMAAGDSLSTGVLQPLHLASWHAMSAAIRLSYLQPSGLSLCTIPVPAVGFYPSDGWKHSAHPKGHPHSPIIAVPVPVLCWLVMPPNAHPQHSHQLLVLVSSPFLRSVHLQKGKHLPPLTHIGVFHLHPHP